MLGKNADPYINSKSIFNGISYGSAFKTKKVVIKSKQTLTFSILCITWNKFIVQNLNK